MMDRRSPPEPVWTPEARTAPVARSLIVTAAPPTASPNTIARFPTTRTMTVVGIPGDGASAAQAATRANKRLIAPAPRMTVRFAIRGMRPVRYWYLSKSVRYLEGRGSGGEHLVDGAERPAGRGPSADDVNPTVHRGGAESVPGRWHRCQGLPRVGSRMVGFIHAEGPGRSFPAENVDAVFDDGGCDPASGRRKISLARPPIGCGLVFLCDAEVLAVLAVSPAPASRVGGAVSGGGRGGTGGRARRAAGAPVGGGRG